MCRLFHNMRGIELKTTDQNTLSEKKLQDSTNEDRQALSTELAMGGQAVIEGVLMRSPFRVAIAVRTPDQKIAVKTYPYTPISKRVKFFGLPIVRGVVGMIESMKIGIEALNWSAETALPEEKDKPKKEAGWMERAGIAISMLFAFAFGLGLFMYLPYLVAKFFVGGDQGQALFHLIAGSIRIIILVGYLLLISRWKDIHRVFQYHGSEHKSIFAYESGTELTSEKAMLQTRFHPRCGTSFLLIVALAAIVFFVIVDTFVVWMWGSYSSVLTRLLIHLPLIPVVAGISYELLKFSSKHTKNRIVRAFIQPGLWLQKITTQEPDNSMCEVAVTALKTAMSKEGEIPAEATSA
jgi:uncharacterized protein YqhQ